MKSHTKEILMPIDRYHSAVLDPSTLTDIQQLERELDIVLLAVEADPTPAQLSDQALQRVKALEQRAGKVLVAYSY
jgi:hypothetical protein